MKKLMSLSLMMFKMVSFSGSLVILLAPTAFSMPESGTVQCVDQQRKIVAEYHWFSSEADEYSTAMISVTEKDGTVNRFKGQRFGAPKPVSVSTFEGKTITVELDPGMRKCSISVAD